MRNYLNDTKPSEADHSAEIAQKPKRYNTGYTQSEKFITAQSNSL